MYRNTYIEINLDNIYQNAKSIISNYNEYNYYFGVVKSNCYGHGMYSVNELIKAGVNYLAVSNLLEAKNIRKYNKNIPILCLEPINLEYINEVIENNITITVSNLDYLHQLKKIGKNKNLKIHIKINSGMNRLGFNDKNEVVEAFTVLREYFDLEGIYSHFSTIGYLDNLYDKQIINFKNITSLIDLSKIKIVHFGKSSSLIHHSKLNFCNGIRLGIILYGVDITINKDSKLFSSLRKQLLCKYKKISNINYGCKYEVLNTLSLYSEVIEVNYISKNEYIGYGLSNKLDSDSYIAVISTGYADGLKTTGSNRYVFINDKKYPILSITSGMIISKVDSNVKNGDKVQIYGKNISIKEMGIKSNTNSYELLAHLNKTLPRIYTSKGREVYKEIWEIK